MSQNMSQNMSQIKLKLCPDEDMAKHGECIYPYYGVAPHRHNMHKTGDIIGSTELLRKEAWPDNFREDSESEGCGVYHCPYDSKCEG